VEPYISLSHSPDSSCVSADISTELGLLRKTVILGNDPPSLELFYSFDWAGVKGSTLRIGNITLIPEGFDMQSLFYRTHNGGQYPETFSMTGHEIDHPKAVSSLVSASYALGMTENTVELGDASKRLVMETDRSTCALIGLITHRTISETFFCRLALSAAEVDDTVPRSGEGMNRFEYDVRIRISCGTPHTR
jgi:hypothetical protein